MKNRQIILKQVQVHNLKAIDLTLRANELIVFTGVSGSGKSSLAFDTIYVEGQRRYVASLSNYARRYIGEMSKPALEHAEGISPTISIEQKTVGANPRSTVGTLTEVYDFLRVLFARVGTAYCPVSGERVSPQSREQIIHTVQGYPIGSRILIYAPYARGRKAEFKEDFKNLLRQGFMRVRVDGTLHNLNEEVALDGNLKHDVDLVIDRLVVEPQTHSRITDALTQALELGEGQCSIVDADSEEERFFSIHAHSKQSGLSYQALEPQDFSFNSPAGMCSQCHGLGEVQEFCLDLIIDPEKSIAQDCCSIASSYTTVRYGNIYRNLAKIHGFRVSTKWKTLSEEAQKIFLYGVDQRWTRMRFTHPTKKTRWTEYVHWQGVLHEAHKRYTEASSSTYRKKMESLMTQQTCPECKGSRLKAYPAATRVGEKTLAEITKMPLEKCLRWFEDLNLKPEAQHIAEELLKEIQQRLRFLLNVGLHYLTLDRTAPTLSGGEAQRVRLASQIGCGLVGVTYILDEPSIGLHPRDNTKLIHTLKNLRDAGNTVIVVEHDEETIRAADRIVDFGPGAGEKGGHLLVNGTLKQLLRHKTSLTGQYLSGRRRIAVPQTRRKKGAKLLCIQGAEHHNLKKINVDFPLGLFTCITGVSGSGKSSLITSTLYPLLANQLHRAEHPVGKYKALQGLEHVDKIVAIDQKPIGRNPRSNPATYTKLFDEIRDLFTRLPESQARGYKPGRFSFNVKEGSCHACSGMGMIKVDMDFMEDAWELCNACQGRRFDRETLDVHYKQKNIHDVLEMSVDEALEFFSAIPGLHHKLLLLQKVGMGYIRLGQSSTTLSGGEAQRIKLAKELSRAATGKTLYILDEPTTGLHFHDIHHLLQVLHSLVDHGNTVVVIEHNMDVVKNADWILDLGPEGGEGGGYLVASGTPEEIARHKTATGQALKAALYNEACFEQPLSDKVPEKQKAYRSITVEGAEQHNLKGIHLQVPREKITVCTGPSGSGKTSFALDTLYAEGQRRYIESLSPYARQFVKQMPKPKVSHIEGLSPAISIEQKAHAGNPRSTVGTMTEIYDYLRILFARVGIAHCPETGEIIRAISKDHVVERILSYPENEKIYLLSPLEIKRHESLEEIRRRFQRLGYLRLRLNKELYELDDEAIPFDRRRKNDLQLVVDRLKVDPSARQRLYEAIEVASSFSEGKVLVLREEGEEILFNLRFAVESTGKAYPEINPQSFAFNTEQGMCPDCQGLGVQYGADLMSNPEVASYSLFQLIRFLWTEETHYFGYQLLEEVLASENIDDETPLYALNNTERQLLFFGSERWYTLSNGLRFRWLGLNTVFSRAGKSAHRVLKESVVSLLDAHLCPSCAGARIHALARHVTIHDRSIGDICLAPLYEVSDFVHAIEEESRQYHYLEEIFKQLKGRLQFLQDVGLSYMHLHRSAPTLSGGETQRIRLARQLGAGLTGVLYVLDEPSIGLHPFDSQKVNTALQKLKKLGNTLLLVEHDPLTIAEADYLFDFGPHSGKQGGHIVAQGSLSKIKKDKNSLTGAYLSGRCTVPLRKKELLPAEDFLRVEKASLHNLKDLHVDIPLGELVCLSGVSGSGKSTLLKHILKSALEKGLAPSHQGQDDISLDYAKVSGLSAVDKVLWVDQNPVGHTIRSDVCTYVDILTPLRSFFAALPDAKIRGLEPKHFSYNHRRGMCTHCWGMGYRKIEMHFLPAVQVTCDQCHGQRLAPLSLEVRYKGKNLGQYLENTVDEAAEIFANVPRLCKALNTLQSVGLGYLTLGQRIATLSGGEAQRMKLSRELRKRATGSTVYLLDEPTTGLHSSDVAVLLDIFDTLVTKGNSIIVIEHHLDVIKNADTLIEMGPGAGAEGGEIVFVGTPEDLAAHPTSKTAPFLKELVSA